MSSHIPYVTDEAVNTVSYKLGIKPDEAQRILELAAPHMAKALMETFAATFDRAATDAKLQPAIHNNIRTMIENYGKAVGPA